MRGSEVSILLFFFLGLAGPSLEGGELWARFWAVAGGVDGMAILGMVLMITGAAGSVRH